MNKFTRRERQVGQLLAQGCRQVDIARQLVISPRTVESHVQNMKRRTGDRTTLALALRLARENPGQPG